jgi:type II secretory pathway pseudopilin PulG
MHPVVETAASLPDWLTAVGGLLVFAATAWLASVAKTQMNDARTASAAEAALVEKQIAASIKQGEAIEEAARAQLQPMVFAHPGLVDTWSPDTPKAVPVGYPKPNPYNLGPGQTGFGYSLENEGTGLALNIEHVIEIEGLELAFGDGMRFVALRPGEAQPVPPHAWVVVIREGQLPDAWGSRVYWARFDNIFNERFETRTSSDPTEAAEFKRIDSQPPPPPGP